MIAILCIRDACKARLEQQFFECSPGCLAAFPFHAFGIIAGLAIFRGVDALQAEFALANGKAVTVGGLNRRLGSDNRVARPNIVSIIPGR